MNEPVLTWKRWPGVEVGQSAARRWAADALGEPLPGRWGETEGDHTVIYSGDTLVYVDRGPDGVVSVLRCRIIEEGTLAASGQGR